MTRITLILFTAFSFCVLGCATRPAEPLAVDAPVSDVRVYDIRDILRSTPNYTNLPGAGGLREEPDFDLNEALSSTNSGGQNKSTEGRWLRFLRKAPRVALLSHITGTITRTIATPEAWDRERSGDGFTIRELNGNLIIQTTPNHHSEILSLLDQMRADRGVVSLEELYFGLEPNDFDIGRQPAINEAEE